MRTVFMRSLLLIHAVAHVGSFDEFVAACEAAQTSVTRSFPRPSRHRAVQRSLHGPQREHCIDASDSDAIAPVTHVVHVVEAEDVGGEGSQASEDAGVAADP